MPISLLTNAATINHDNLATRPEPSLDFKHRTIESSAQHNSFNNTNNTFFLSDNILTQKKSINPSPSNDFKSLVKKLNTEYGSNELIQDSLTALYETKQLWNEVDIIANNFAYDVLFILKLDQYIESGLTQSPQTSHIYLSQKNLKIPSLQHSESSDITIFQIRQTYVNASAHDFDGFGDDIFASLFQLSTLYYLIALYILIVFLQWLIRFVLRLFP